MNEHISGGTVTGREQKQLYIAEIVNEEGYAKTYRIVRAEDEWDARNLVYRNLLSSGTSLSTADVVIHECIEV